MLRNQVLSLVFEQSTDGLLLMEDGVFIDCNPAVVQLLGCADSSEIIGQRPSDFSPAYQPDGSPSAVREQELIAQALAEGSICFEWVHQRVDGRQLPVEILLTAVEYEGRRILYSNWRDITRRREAEKALDYRRRLEALIINMSSRFINLPAEEIDAGIQQVLAEMGAFVEADRSYVFAYAHGMMHNAYEWCAPGITPQIDRMQNIPITAMRWSNERIRRGDILNTPVVADLPPEAQAEKDEFQIQGIRSVLVVPMERRGQVVGFIGFDAVRRQRRWPEEIIDLQRLAAGIIANVLDRRDAEIQLRETNTMLEEKIEERTHQLVQRRQVAESLRETLAVVNSSQSLEDTLAHLVQQARHLTGAEACALYSIDTTAQTGRVEASSGMLEDLKPENRQFDLSTTPGRELLLILSRPEPLAINYDKSRVNDILNDPDLTDALRTERLKVSQLFSASLAVALSSREEAFGALVLHYRQPQDFTDHQITTAKTLAEQASLAIENARLHQSEQERRMESEQRHHIAEGLREGLMVLNSNRTLTDILDFVVRQAVRLLDTGGGALYLLDDSGRMLRVGASSGLDATYTALEIPVGGAITGRAVALGEAVSVPDMRASEALLQEYLRAPNMPPGWMSALRQLTAQYNAVLSVPVRTPSQTYGAITLYYPQRQLFTDEVIGLAVAFAGQAALVIENARLRERVRETAAVQERSRLARDLHDAVTQTLFSASLIADTLPDLWAIDQADARQQLEHLGRLTRGALAEMRTLLIELRPARLVETDMYTLLQQLVDAAQGRSKVDISLSLRGAVDLPPDEKIVFYRITQEALNNVMKHAQAQHVFVSLRGNEDHTTLQILDDGQGFDPGMIEAGHFGVQIMQERAASIGATFVMDTRPGEGTDIQVIWRKT